MVFKAYMLISVAVCTYNGELYIKEQLDSIIFQEINSDIKVEIIIVDDNSTDNTIEIIDSIPLPENISITTYKNNKNIGFVKNFEKAISMCNGEFIFLSDQDDFWKKNKMSLMLEKIEGKQMLIYSNALLVDQNLKSINQCLLAKKYAMSGANNLYFIFNNSISGNTLMFRKTLKDYILPFPEKIKFHDIWIGFVASSISKIQFLDENLILYRQHFKNVTNITTKNRKKLTYKEKIKNKKNSFKNRINYLESYSTFLNSKNLQLNRVTINEIYYELSKYNSYIFNIKLFVIFIKNRKKIFIHKKQNTIINIIKNCFGLKAYKLLPFL